MDQKKHSNKITEIVRLQQMLKKWKKLAVTPKTTPTVTGTTTTAAKKSVGFLKRTLSFTDASSSSSSASSVPSTGGVPKGFLAVCVGEELRRFVIPTVYLSHKAFVTLLRDAEEEFGFQQEGVLRIPCEVSVFENVLRMVEEKKMKKESNNHSLCSSEVGWMSPNTLTTQYADN
ncbi:SAUR-like auxin-responsive protein family [Zostera marina]|uniref:SAUR-like auxin-responsive protein family n=1 Tax=Zostera marina TaxID=29655 RepID=A0A0K9PNB6_ZOSMR|nr:SAUR-like auxin-responsive protein family [Zostera marina]